MNYTAKGLTKFKIYLHMVRVLVRGIMREGPRCHYVSAYTQSGKSVINHYDPVINIIAKAAFAAGGGGTNGGGELWAQFLCRIPP